METINATQAYEEILEILNKYKDICAYSITEMENISKNHLFGLELKEKYGFEIDPKKIHISGRDYYRFDDYRFIGWHGEKYNRTISWLDDGSQPENEFLLSLGFSTGAYIFGEDYPKELFDEFFNELKSYNPKYIDTTNKYLYFSMENAGRIFNEFNDILKKYNDKNREDYKKRRATKLRAELEKLEN